MLLHQCSQLLWTCRLLLQLRQQSLSRSPQNLLLLRQFRHKPCCRSLKPLRLLPSRQPQKKLPLTWLSQSPPLLWLPLRHQPRLRQHRLRLPPLRRLQHQRL